MAQDTTIYDLLFKHARIGDHPEEVDIGITSNRVAAMGPGLKAAHARVIVEAEGYKAMPSAALGKNGATGVKPDDPDYAFHQFVAMVKEGRAADFILVDAGHVIMIIRGGKVITDDEGLTIPDVSRAGPYSNYR
jgi:hypothetical protein